MSNTIRKRLAALGHARQRRAPWCAVNGGLIHELLDTALGQEEQLNRMLEPEPPPELDWMDRLDRDGFCEDCCCEPDDVSECCAEHGP